MIIRIRVPNDDIHYRIHVEKISFYDEDFNVIETINSDEEYDLIKNGFEVVGWEL